MFKYSPTIKKKLVKNSVESKASFLRSNQRTKNF